MGNKTSTYSLDSLYITNSNGDEYEIKSLLISMNIYENLFTNTMSADLQLKDNVGLIEGLPFKGNEQLTVEFNLNPKHKYKHIFDISSVGNVINTADRTLIYELKLVSPEFTKNISTKIQKYYTGRASDHIFTIATRILGIPFNKIYTQNTENTKDIVVPNMRPFEYINYLAANSVVPNTNQNVSNFIFYENRDKFVFTSIEELFNTSADYTFNYNSTITQGSQGDYDPFGVIDYHFEKLYNTTENINKGMYSSRMYTHNIITKEYTKKDYQYNSNFDNQEHVDDNPVQFNDSEYDPRAKSIFLPTNEQLHPSYTYDKTSLPRMSQMQQLENYKLILRCFGETYTTVGNIIKFNLPTIRNTDTGTLDTRLSGKYIITKKRHILTQMTYQTVLECRKDCFKG